MDELIPAAWSGSSAEELAAALGAEDIFVLRRVSSDRFAHIGGVGRGAGWAGIVELQQTELPEFGSTGVVYRRRTEQPTHVFGPYYVASVAIVKVSPDVLVVFGGSEGAWLDSPDDDFLELARYAAEGLVEVTPAKRLADELEILTALQALLQSPPETLPAALEHLAREAAGALSCEVGIAWLENPTHLAICDKREGAELELQAVSKALATLSERNSYPICVQQASLDELPAPFRSQDGIVAYYLLEIRQPARGCLLLLHTTASHKRGFTSLCQSLGEQLLRAGEPLLTAAALRDRMHRELDLANAQARCDSLTGLSNRLAWEEAISQSSLAPLASTGVIVLDGAGLKRINDLHGHHVGDQMLCQIAEILRASVRTDDTIARLGGDEFGVLLPGADQELTSTIVGRIREAINQSETPADGPALRVSIGSAIARGGDLVDAQQRADAQMLCEKRNANRGPAEPTDIRLAGAA